MWVHRAGHLTSLPSRKTLWKVDISLKFSVGRFQHDLIRCWSSQEKRYNPKWKFFTEIYEMTWSWWFWWWNCVFLLCLLMFGCCLYQQNVRWRHWTDEIISDLIFTRKFTSVFVDSLFFVGLTVLRPGFIRFHNIIIGFHGDCKRLFSLLPAGISLRCFSIVEPRVSNEGTVCILQSCPMSPPAPWPAGSRQQISVVQFSS